LLAPARRFNFDNRFYLDACTPTVTTNTSLPSTPISALSRAQYLDAHKAAACRYTSQAFRAVAKQQLIAAKQGITPLPTKDSAGMDWSNSPTCQVPAPHPNANCPHPTNWPYTRNDGFLAQACQAPQNDVQKQVQDAMYEYMDSNTQWLQDYFIAYGKMMELGEYGGL
jgi:hypothetical protein